MYNPMDSKEKIMTSQTQLSKLREAQKHLWVKEQHWPKCWVLWKIATFKLKAPLNKQNFQYFKQITAIK